MSGNSYRKGRYEAKGDPYFNYGNLAAYFKWNRYWNRIDRETKRRRNRIRSRFWQEMVAGMYGDDLRQSIEGFERCHGFDITNPMKAIRRKVKE